jgi:hypothetical protein
MITNDSGDGDGSTPVVVGADSNKVVSRRQDGTQEPGLQRNH